MPATVETEQIFVSTKVLPVLIALQRAQSTQRLLIRKVCIERIINSFLHCYAYSYLSINNLSESIIIETIGGIQMLYRQFNNSGVSLTVLHVIIIYK